VHVIAFEMWLLIALQVLLFWPESSVLQLCKSLNVAAGMIRVAGLLCSPALHPPTRVLPRVVAARMKSTRDMRLSQLLYCLQVCTVHRPSPATMSTIREGLRLCRLAPLQACLQYTDCCPSCLKLSICISFLRAMCTLNIGATLLCLHSAVVIGQE